VKRYRQIVWDWNGTLLDDVQASVNAINRLLADRSLPPTHLERYRETFGFPVRNYYTAIGFRLECEDWDALARDYHALFLADPSIRVRPEAVPVLQFCRNAGIGLSVLSASEQSILRRMLADGGLTRLFQQIQGVDNLHGRSKVETGRQLIARLRCPAGEILFVGDTLHDHEVATAMGCDCVLIAQGHQTRARLLSAGCPVIDSLADFPDFLGAPGREDAGASHPRPSG
jgi:phosphoglycolate phosphatase